MIEGQALTNLNEVIRAGDYVRRGAESHADKPAIIVPELGVELTYAELDRRIGRAVVLLREWGLREGDRIAYLGKNSDHFYVMLFAAMRAGFVFVPLNWRSVAREIGFFLADSQAKLLSCDADFLPIAREAVADLFTAPLVILTEPGTAPGSLRERLLEPGPLANDFLATEDTVCLQLYTSGTTGQPKGALADARTLSLMRHAETLAADFPKWPGETIVSAMPNFHVAGISWMLMGLHHRGTCILTPNPAASNVVKLIRQYSATRTFAVPTVIRSIIEEVKASGSSLPTLRTIFYGAAPIGKALLSDAMATLGCGFLQFYGMTEVTGSATFLAPKYHDLNRPELMNSVGLPFPGVALDIRDSDGRSLPAMSAGEIWIRTPTMMTGYGNRPEATNEAIKDGWYRTGDGGYLDAEGFLYLTDRIKDMIVSGGENVYPIEVEEALRKFAGVQDLVVVGVPDERWGEAVTAAVECRAGERVDGDAMMEFARRQLAAYKCPKRIIFVPVLPRTASGKLQRSKVRTMLREQGGFA